MGKLRRFGALVLSGFGKFGVLIRASLWAVLLGVLETLRSERGRRVLGVLAIAGVAVAIVAARPVRVVAPGDMGVRIGRVTGATAQVGEGWALVVPGLQELRTYSLRDQIYRPLATEKRTYQSVEGLSLGVDLSVRWALDPARVVTAVRRLPDATTAEIGRTLVEPAADGVAARVLARHTVREIFASGRGAVQKEIEDELRGMLAEDGVVLRGVAIGSVDLPAEYKAGLEALLTEELASDKMRFTLELKEKQVKQAELEAEADKERRQQAAEAAAQEEIIAAKAHEEAMAHVLPFKEKEIEQRRLEAEAAKVQRLKQAEADAEARRLESAGEADARRKLADADAYRLEVTGKATTDELARESTLIAANPLLIQKTMADKLSDKIQVIIAPPSSGGFVAGALLGASRPSEPALAKAPAAEIANPENE